MQGLVDMIDDYNISIDILESHLKDSSIDSDFLYNEFFHVTNKNDSLAKAWGKIMTIVYGYNEGEKSCLFNEYIARPAGSGSDLHREGAEKGRRQFVPAGKIGASRRNLEVPGAHPAGYDRGCVPPKYAPLRKMR